MMGPAPHPVDEANRLSPDFVEFLMGFPPGWNGGESRTQRLKQLGNAVVWQQAYHALEILFAGQVPRFQPEVSTQLHTPTATDAWAGGLKARKIRGWENGRGFTLSQQVRAQNGEDLS